MATFRVGVLTPRTSRVYSSVVVFHESYLQGIQGKRLLGVCFAVVRRVRCNDQRAYGTIYENNRAEAVFFFFSSAQKRRAPRPPCVSPPLFLRQLSRRDNVLGFENVARPGTSSFTALMCSFGRKSATWVTGGGRGSGGGVLIACRKIAAATGMLEAPCCRHLWRDGERNMICALRYWFSV